MSKSVYQEVVNTKFSDCYVFKFKVFEIIVRTLAVRVESRVEFPSVENLQKLCPYQSSFFFPGKETVLFIPFEDSRYLVLTKRTRM